ncbi:response regulator transcription factor [Paenibacillus lautus]|uniref:DNA-binding response regulator n=1 Tax=Paenibacillus lautus TaxID=1401 RepID=A0A385TGV0_PAELA|nr:response regulator transcription factor [Paenibacillus lautus]AYB42863.1 DNA-binding response regulator [Paenibacillus lautus]VTR21157.1 nitrate/nitrite response regulator protein [Actinobacillus pleuropneumoniae]
MKPVFKIMIVDDEMLVRQGIKHLLDWEQEGYRIVGEASNGLEALNLIDEVSPHVILTDIVMPVMGGEKLVKVVKEKYPHIEIIVLSSFSEFDYVRSTFQSGVADYILKPKLEADYLLSILNKVTAKMVAMKPDADPRADQGEAQILQSIEKLMTGYESAPDPLLLHSRFPFGQYLFFGADLKQMKESGDRWSFGNELESELQKIAMTDMVFMRLGFVNDTALFLLNVNPERRNELVIELRQLIPKLVHDTSETHFVISQCFADFNSLGEVYHGNYLKLMRYGFFLRERTLIEYEHLPGLPDSHFEYDMGELMEQLKRKQYRKAFTGFLEYACLRSMDYRTDIFEFKSSLGNFIFNVATTLGKMKVETGSLENAKYDYFRKIDEARYAGEAIAVVEAFIREAERAIGETNTSVNPNMDRLLEYIQDHYADPITLTEVARQFHFNASYLSSYFASYNGEGFSEYLNKIRLEKAMELLLTTELTISEISASVGYSDQSYFTKVFKKQTGISPSQFRRQDVREIRES